MLKKAFFFTINRIVKQNMNKPQEVILLGKL